MDTDRMVLSWQHIEKAAILMLHRHQGEDRPGIYGVPRGGSVPAALMAAWLGTRILDHPLPGCLVVDDLIDSGRTRDRYSDYDFDVLYRKPDSPFRGDVPLADGWVVFPWESTDEHAGPADAVTRLLQHVGEDPNRDGLLATPDRVLRSLTEMTQGYHDDPAAILATTFDVPYDELVLVRDVEFVSLCEHHLLPFTGTATVGYLPSTRVVGLSKLARLVECFARRLQVQERMTCQITESLDKHLSPRGSGCIVTAQHSCMACRGVRKRADMVTSSLTGSLRKKRARAEFLALAR